MLYAPDWLIKISELLISTVELSGFKSKILFTLYESSGRLYPHSGQ